MSVNNPPAKANLKVLHLLFGTDLVREQLSDFQRYTLELRAWAKTLAATGAIALLLTLGYMLAQYPFCGALLVLILPVFGYALLMCLALMEKTDGVLRTLNNTLDIRAISPLCEALEWRDNSVRRVARNTLPSLLTQLRATDSLLLTRIARDCLYRQLVMSRADRHERLLVAILQALEQVGDAQAVPAVERLAAATPRTPAQQRVHQAGQMCLPYLHARFGHHAGRDSLLRATEQEEAMPHTLLRSSDSPATEADSLLRSVKESTDQQPEQLLRPG